MNSIIINTSDQKYLKVELEPVYQKNNRFFICKINAQDFLKLYTVRPTEYDLNKNSSFAKSFESDKDYYNYLIKDDEKRLKEKDFQRNYDKDRVRKIAEFINNDEYPFFPNTIIATCDIINDYDEFDINENTTFNDFAAIDNKPQILSFLEDSGNKTYLYIPYIENSILIIDGQHRLRGLQNSNEDSIKNYDLLVSLIIGFDRSVIAKLFYTINYEQKNVNKSVLYQLTGEFSSELNEVTFMHYVVKVLNELDTSPFYAKIKMLGVNPKNISKAEKKYLTISQAFLIDYLLKTISYNSLRTNFKPIFIYYYRDQELQIHIIRFVIKYFNAIKNIRLQDWENPDTNILTKGIGIGAFIKVLHFFFIKLFVTEWGNNPSKMLDITEEDLKIKLRGIESIDFSKLGEFGGTASAGGINKLMKVIIGKIEYFGDVPYDEFYKIFEQRELKNFSNWLEKNIK